MLIHQVKATQLFALHMTIIILVYQSSLMVIGATYIVSQDVRRMTSCEL